jgi:hypothetical protein
MRRETARFRGNALFFGPPESQTLDQAELSLEVHRTMAEELAAPGE